MKKWLERIRKRIWLRSERNRKSSWLRLRWTIAKRKHRARAQTITFISPHLTDEQYEWYRKRWIKYNDKLNDIGDRYKLWAK